MGIRISQLPEIGSVTLTDYFVVADQAAGKTYKTQASALSTLFVSQSIIVQGAVNSSRGTIAPVFQFSMPTTSSVVPSVAGGVVLADSAGSLRIYNSDTSSLSNIFAQNGIFASASIGTGAPAVNFPLEVAANIGPTIDNTYALGSGVYRWSRVSSVSGSFSNILVSSSMYISGNLRVDGLITGIEKSFLIDHPTQPGKKLQYACLEGPENGVYVRGILTESNIINLPEYWEGLVDSDTITVNLTPVGKYQPLYVLAISDKAILIQIAEKPINEINCYYTVFAERKDVPKLKTEF